MNPLSFPRVLLRLLTLLAAVLVTLWIAVLVHEGFHMLLAQLLGFEPSMNFSWGTAYVSYSSPIPVAFWKDSLIGLSGGLGAGLLFLGFWALTGRKGGIHELDNGVPFLALGIGQILYAPFDAWLFSWVNWGAMIGGITGFVLAGFWYRRSLPEYLGF